jgi:hypothetical protein
MSSCPVLFLNFVIELLKLLDFCTKLLLFLTSTIYYLSCPNDSGVMLDYPFMLKNSLITLILIQVERVASMLNYFLLQLAGPQRKSLTVKDPEKYEFKPKQLLKQVP